MFYGHPSTLGAASGTIILITKIPGLPPPREIQFSVSQHRPVIEQSSNQKLLTIGIFAEVYLVDQKTIRKAPRSRSDEDILPISREATIYNIIGNHPQIAECLSGERTDLVEVKYYKQGDLAAFTKNNKITNELTSKWFGKIIEAVAVIHHFGIIHSDLALRQLFNDDDYNIRLGDFNSSQYPDHPALGYEKATHCLPRGYELPNTVSSDLFALGSTLYELVTGYAPYSELYPKAEAFLPRDHDEIRAQSGQQQIADFQVEQRYIKHDFPDVSRVFRGDIILGCWNGTISSADDALRMYISLA